MFYDILSIAESLRRDGATALIVGGAVRDLLLGQVPKDFDIEVYGIASLDELQKHLSRFGCVAQVGKSFGVLKLHTQRATYNVSLPRIERKVAKGHKGFAVRCDADLSFEQAAKRRDFTINAMGYDPIDAVMYDPYGGQEDLQRKVLRHTDDATFIEDPLRVYRAVQFAARFELSVDTTTAALCRRMVRERMLDELPKEQVFEELKKLLLQAPRPSQGFELMREWGITKRYFPELDALIDIPQDFRYHPEGDVWVHTMMALDAMQKLCRSCESGNPHADKKDEKRHLTLMYAVLCHDLGKPSTTTLELQNGASLPWCDAKAKAILSDDPSAVARIRAIGHEKAGIEPTRRLLARITNKYKWIESILPYVRHHLKPAQFYRNGARAGAIRRLARKVEIPSLVLVAKADFLGRTTLEAKTGRFEAGEWLLAQAKALEVHDAPHKPLLQGRDLVAMGLKPSPRFKELLDAVFEAQLDGKVVRKDDAIEYVKRLIGG